MLRHQGKNHKEEVDGATPGMQHKNEPSHQRAEKRL
jgi:hypothetical protein